MTDTGHHSPTVSTGLRETERTTGSGSLTRGFLFADLRGYTAFIERKGAVEAADLLMRYRAVVRDVVSRFGGAEIKTEGDSFYVVFPSVSDALGAGLAIVDAARADAGAHEHSPIQVGVGVHAGETIETADGYVGTPVNVAARLCAIAGPNEVLATDTVRALVSSVVPVRFERRSRRSLKGIADPVAVYRVVAAEPLLQPVRSGRRGRLTQVGVLVVTVLVAGAGLFALASRPDTAGESQRSSTAASNPGPLVAAASASSGVNASLSPSAASTAFPTPTPIPAIPNGLELQPGMYRTRVLRPAVTFVVDAGWTSFGDVFGDADNAFDLGRTATPGVRFTLLWSDLVSKDGCIEHTVPIEVAGGTYGPEGPPVVLGSLPGIDSLIRRGFLSGGPWITRTIDPAAASGDANEYGLIPQAGLGIDVVSTKEPRCPEAQSRGLALFHRISPRNGQPPAEDWVYLPRGGSARILPLGLAWTNGTPPAGDLIAIIQATDPASLEHELAEAEKLLANIRVWPWMDTDPPF